MKKLIFIFSLIWQLPQLLLGFLLFIFYSIKAKKIEIRDMKVLIFCLTKGVGLSISIFIFLKRDIENYSYEMYGKKRYADDLINHEIGHTIQSLLLGPSFLLLAGIPSVIWNLIYNILKLQVKNIDYYWFYTESWADYLGGVKWNFIQKNEI